MNNNNYMHPATTAAIYKPQNLSLPTGKPNTQVTCNREFYLLSKKLRKFLPFNFGLKNHGNTCFMNCVLQCLFHTSPLCEYFVTSQHENDMKVIYMQHEASPSPAAISSRTASHFPLTRSFHRLLLSMWQNMYESAYSVQIKSLIGDLNPTFAGVNQNDSHEFCVWLLDRLSQELSIRTKIIKRTITDNNDNEADATAKTILQDTTNSFIEDLFKVEFKSTVTCSKCKYRSTKYETDMMLSLPLPQTANGSNPQQQQQHNMRIAKPLPPKRYQRKSLYANLILTSHESIRSFLNTTQLTAVNPLSNLAPFASAESQAHSMNGSKVFYNFQTGSPSMPPTVTAPVNIKVALNVHVTTDDDYYEKEMVKLSETSTNNTVINPDFHDLKHYLGSTYQINESSLVFVDFQNTFCDLNDEWSVKEKIIKNNSSLFVVELSSVAAQNDQTPLINIIAFNVSYETRQHERLSCNFGSPFVVLINRDCSYADLCKKLLEQQAKYFKDMNILKYKVRK